VGVTRLGQAGLVVLALILVLAGCGSSSSGSSGSTVSPSAYAASLCNAVGPFEKDIAARQNALDPTAIKSPAQGKTTLEGFLGAVVADTRKATDTLKAAGVPDVPHGKAVASAFVSLFQRLQTTLEGAAQQARALPTTSAGAFKRAAAQLGSSVKASMSDLGSSISSLHSPKLEAAARKVSACRQLGS
jgi:hypothetical protein